MRVLKDKKFIFIALSWVLVAFGQPALFSWLGLIASALGFSLFWKALDGVPSANRGKVSFGWFFLVQLVQTFWMVSLEYQGIYILLLYALVSGFLGWQFFLLTKLIYAKKDLNLLSICFLSSFWVVSEWIRLHISCGYAFNFFGVFLTGHLFSLQLASVFGIFGLSFWVVLTNLWGLKTLRSFSVFNVVKWLFLALFPYLFGFFHLSIHEKKGAQEKKNILLLQTGLTPSEKYPIGGKMDEFIPALKQWNRAFSWIEPYKEASLDLIVFPEASFPFGLDQYIYDIRNADLLLEKTFGNKIHSCLPEKMFPFVKNNRVSNAYFFQAIANVINVPVLGGLDYQVGKTFYNSAFYFEPQGKKVQRYDKRVLLPLAEAMPFAFLRSLSSYYGIEDFFEPGKLPQYFSAKELLISPSICYEELFPSLILEGRQKGGNLFVNLSNDGYFPGNFLPKQHFTHGLVRAVENGVPLVRACNGGVTAGIDCFGRVVDKLEDSFGNVEKLAGGLKVSISSYSYRTPFSLWGEAPLLIICILFCLKEILFINALYFKNC